MWSRWVVVSPTTREVTVQRAIAQEATILTIIARVTTTVQVTATVQAIIQTTIQEPTTPPEATIQPPPT